MTAFLGPALAFYVRHFEEAEALRGLHEAPDGIALTDWFKVKRVIGGEAVREAKALIKNMLGSEIGQTIRNAGLFPICEYGEKAFPRHWALKLSIGEKEDGPEAVLLGLAIDSDKQLGPWLGLFLDYPRQRATMLRRARATLSSRGIDHLPLEDLDRGWAGQLVLGRFPLQPDTTAGELSSWLCPIGRTVLVDLWKDISIPAPQKEG